MIERKARSFSIKLTHRLLRRTAHQRLCTVSACHRRWERCSGTGRLSDSIGHRASTTVYTASAVPSGRERARRVESKVVVEDPVLMLASASAAWSERPVVGRFARTVLSGKGPEIEVKEKRGRDSKSKDRAFQLGERPRREIGTRSRRSEVEVGATSTSRGEMEWRIH